MKYVSYIFSLLIKIIIYLFIALEREKKTRDAIFFFSLMFLLIITFKIYAPVLFSMKDDL